MVLGPSAPSQCTRGHGAWSEGHAGERGVPLALVPPSSNTEGHAGPWAHSLSLSALMSPRLPTLTLPAFSHPPLNSVDASQLSRHSTCPEHSPRPPTRLLRLGAELPPNTQTHHRSVPSRGSPHPPPPNKPSSSPPGSSMGSLGICELLPGTEGRDPTALTTCNPRMNAWGHSPNSTASNSNACLMTKGHFWVPTEHLTQG